MSINAQLIAMQNTAAVTGAEKKEFYGHEVKCTYNPMFGTSWYLDKESIRRDTLLLRLHGFRQKPIEGI